MQYIGIGILGLFLLAVVFFGGKGVVGTQPSAGTQPVGNAVVRSTTRTVDLSDQGLTQVPMDIFSRTDTEVLNLSGNQLSGALPAEVRQLQDLRVLDLSNNRFTGVPAEIGQLSQLEELNLANNQLTGLPHELGNLHNLKLLDLSGNQYSQQDLAVIRAALPASTVIKTQ